MLLITKPLEVRRILSINWVVWPQTEPMVKFTFGGGTSQHITSSENVAILSRLRYLNKAVSSQIYNWQYASTKLAICTAHIEGCQAGPRALLHALHHYAGRVKIILAHFNLVVTTPTAKPPNLIPHQNLTGYTASTFIDTVQFSGYKLW